MFLIKTFSKNMVKVMLKYGADRSSLLSGENHNPVAKKSYKEYSESFPDQLSLFELLEEPSEVSPSSQLSKPKKYSQSVEKYDFLPKVYYGKGKSSKESLPVITRHFESNGQERVLEIYPAQVKDHKTGETTYHYLGKREEIVEDVLRKLVVEGNGIYLDGQLGLKFSVYQVRKELEKHSHTLSFVEVIESLRILAFTRFELRQPDKKRGIVFSPIDNFGYEGEDDEMTTFIIFSKMVTEGINSLKFRLYDYERVMKYKNVIARQLHKRMSYYFTQASITNIYTIKLSTIIRDFGLTAQKRIQTNLIDVEKALEEMIKKDVLLNYQVEKIWNEKETKLLDVKLHLRPSISFSNETKKANKYDQIVKGQGNVLTLDIKKD